MNGIKGSTPQSTCHPERKYFSRGLCKACYTKWYREGKDRSKENHYTAAKVRRKVWQKKNREKARKSVRRAGIRRVFNLTVEQYENKLAAQEGICALCSLPFYGEFMGGGDPVLDHNHTTNKVRDFIHRMCNTALGQFRDDPKICRQAAIYLEKHLGD